MKYRTLGKSGLKVSVIGLGTWQFGGEWGKVFTQEEVTAIFRTALETGINFVDTAECYGEHLSERMIGEALKEIGAGSREKFILATKFGHHFVKPFERTEPRSGADVAKQLEDSLVAMGTDHIDLYQYHSWGDGQFEAEDVRLVLEKAKAAGKVRHIGNSIAASVKGTRQMELSPKFGVEAVQLIYNRLSREPEDAFFPVCERLHLGVLARVPLASGLLSGKYLPGARFPADDVRAKWQQKGMEERLAAVEELKRTELPAGVPMGQWALAWCLKSPAVQCVIPGCKSAEQVAENARAAELVDGKHVWAVK